MSVTAARKMANPAFGQPTRRGRTRVTLTNPVIVKPDPYALAVIALMAIATVSTAAVELFGVPRMTLLSIPFIGYILFAIGGKLHPILVRFVAAYVLAFAPSTAFMLAQGGIKWTSVIQGALGLVAFLTIGSYFYYWLIATPLKSKSRSFLILSVLFVAISGIELLIPGIFYYIRSSLYDTDWSGAEFALQREARVYGARPTAFFSEPSNFARYIGIMMAAYLASTAASSRSRWAFGVFLLLTRSVSIFVALPALINEARRAIATPPRKLGRQGKSGSSPRLLGLVGGIILILIGVAYTQSTRIAEAFSNSSAAVSGDSSLNERILIPMGYLYDENRAMFLGIGPTPQDEVNDYAISRTRSIYKWQRSYSDRTAIAASIFTVAGMGVLGIILFLAFMGIFVGRSGIELVLAFFLVNFFSSGYNSTISLVPSGLVFGLLLYQQSIRSQ